MAEPGPRQMTPEEFFIWQLDQDERYELVEGVPVPLRAVTGASNRHEVILVDCLAELHARLREKPCRVASADTAPRTSIRKARRPDVTVDCAPPDEKSYEARRPVVVVEALSPSTRTIDRFTRIDEYRNHPTPRHILLIEPATFAAKLYSRSEGGEWTDEDLIGKEAVIDFTAIEVSLPLAALYERLEPTG